MHLYINLFGRLIPTYGLMIVTGTILANLFALLVVRRTGQDFNDVILLECYGVLGGFVGAKILYLIVSYKVIDWRRITDLQYFNALMQSGFVFYGGLIGGILCLFLGGKIHGIKPIPYVRKLIFLIPFVHCFGRIGCFLAGCCYGRPYDGPGAVIFPKNSFALPGVKLFPVQLLEACLLLCISMILLFLQMKRDCPYTLEWYLILYGIVRFVLEYFRYDGIRGAWAGLSTSQWVSIGLEIMALLSLYSMKKNKTK